jgi:hypothetical protein
MARMCLFTRPVQSVAATSIFARLEGEEQLLAYEMQFSAEEALAMVLPLPVAVGTQSIRFVDLSGYPKLFKHLAGLDYSSVFQSLLKEYSLSNAAPTLPVQAVGAYEASFVPTRADFERLDARFRLEAEAWRALPVEYHDYGFAVFQLRPGLKQEIHPMALAFPTRHRELAFFPTVHLHDGGVHHEAEFDHDLYVQLPGIPVHPPGALPPWAEQGWASSAPVGEGAGIDLAASQGLLAGELPCHRCRLEGNLANRDVRVASAEFSVERPVKIDFAARRIQLSGLYGDGRRVHFVLPLPTGKGEVGLAWSEDEEPQWLPLRAQSDDALAEAALAFAKG